MPTALPVLLCSELLSSQFTTLWDGSYPIGQSTTLLLLQGDPSSVPLYLAYEKYSRIMNLVVFETKAEAAEFIREITGASSVRFTSETPVTRSRSRGGYPPKESS
jgi:hypothetical protein